MTRHRRLVARVRHALRRRDRRPAQPTKRSGMKCKWTRCDRPWNGGPLLCCDTHEDMTLDIRAEVDE